MAKYEPLQLCEMIARADEIVWVTIAELTDEKLNIEVEGFLILLHVPLRRTRR